MKTRIISIAAVICMALAACSRGGDHDTQNGLAVGIVMPNNDEVVNDLTIWLFHSDSTIYDSYSYKEAVELGKTLFTPEPGDYYVVAGVNLGSAFAKSEANQMGTLLWGLSDVSALSQVYYGVQKVTVKADELTVVIIQPTQLLASIQLNIKNIASEVTSVLAELLDAAVGYYPGKGTVTADSMTVSLGVVTPSEVASFPTKWVMPTVVGNSTWRLVFTYNTGDVVEYLISAPQIKSGDTYVPTIDFITLRPKIVNELNEINGWKTNDEEEKGEIFNPKE